MRDELVNAGPVTVIIDSEDGSGRDAAKSPVLGRIVTATEDESQHDNNDQDELIPLARMRGCMRLVYGWDGFRLSWE